jgi:hypothetical protein
MWVGVQKQWLGFAHRFRPTYALANVGHPSLPHRPLSPRLRIFNYLMNKNVKIRGLGYVPRTSGAWWDTSWLGLGVLELLVLGWVGPGPGRWVPVECRCAANLP